MNNLIEFIKNTQDLSREIDTVVNSRGNGLNTISDKISHIKKIITDNNYENTYFEEVLNTTDNKNDKVNTELNERYQLFLKEIPEFMNKLNFDYLGTLNKLVEHEDFINQWDNLSEVSKLEVIYFDRDCYKILRQKLNVNDFDFMFNNEQSFYGDYPELISGWINAENKMQFLKIKNKAKNTKFEEFFNLEETKQMEFENSKQRKSFAINYLIQLNKRENNTSWYDRLDVLDGHKSTLFHYVYHFLNNLEDEFNGYKKIKKTIQLPEILKMWCGQTLDKSQLKKELMSFHKEMLEVENQDKSVEIKNKYPLIELSENLKKSLTEAEFKNMRDMAKNTEYEGFFDNGFTEKMKKSSSYEREAYMYIYFRNDFIKNIKDKSKPKFN